MKVAYLVNQYPKVSHSFIRREILALERQGLQIERFAVRGWDGDLVDPEDVAERSRTRYVLQGGAVGLLSALAGSFMRSPSRFLSAFRLALQMSRRADRPLPLHMIYLAEACCLAQWLRQSGAQHLHAHFGTNSAEVAMLASLLADVPYSFTVHGPEEFDKPAFIGIGEKIRRAAFVVAITSFCRSQLFRWVEAAHWGKIKEVHCGLEEAFHDVTPVPVPVAPRLVCIGRLCEQKGQLLLVEAVGRLRRMGVRVDLVLAGDGEMRQVIEQRIAELDLKDSIRITGWISSAQVRDEILAARAMVLPSFAEGLPVVIMEAMALRRPVITTYIAGIPELVLHEETGWLVPAGGIDELVSAMADCLGSSSGELERMGIAARARVLARHDIEQEAGRLAAYFRDPQQTLAVAPVADGHAAAPLRNVPLVEAA
ncbi:glycosyltransferase family 4 protein [Uliginosibacterium sp. H1]|uniref:glycosyltransferase family 4 protein n=1 Tax=Uliginosibacterium sp. H1 TaxID=3114757 RepID=UPI002E18F247|nr:glycosyltransferase family 4 protein [Uliginosibacterium sp. H1]